MSFKYYEGDNLSSTMTTFSGCDIKAYFENYEIGNLQGISLSVNREVRPVFTMGSPNVRSYSRGKRGVAGSMVMTTFDRDAFFTIKKEAYYAAKSSEVADKYEEGLVAVVGDSTNLGSQSLHPNYSDQIPPFNITLVGMNEFGNAMVMRIFAVHLVSEGQGISVDDNVAESQFTFVAHSVQWWRPMYRKAAEVTTLDGLDVEDLPLY